MTYSRRVNLLDAARVRGPLARDGNGSYIPGSSVCPPEHTTALTHHTTSVQHRISVPIANRARRRCMFLKPFRSSVLNWPLRGTDRGSAPALNLPLNQPRI